MRKSKYMALSILLALVLVLGTVCVPLTAQAVEVGKIGSISVVTQDIEDLKATDFTMNVYRVASVDENYFYTPEPGFEVLSDLTFTKENGEEASFTLRDLKYADSESWSYTAQQAAELAKSMEPAAQATVHNGEATVDQLPTGLYLLIPQDANAGEYIYKFSPVLISLPSLDDAGTSIYDIEGITLKAEQIPGLTSIEIVKKLLTFSEKQGQTTFVFQVEATKDGATVYSNVVPIAFKEPGVKSVLVDQIPIGSKVTVTEVYSGAAYELVSDGTQVIEVALPLLEGEDPQSVSFTNDYNHKIPNVPSVVNKFTYDGVIWNWDHVTYRTEN